MPGCLLSCIWYASFIGNKRLLSESCCVYTVQVLLHVWVMVVLLTYKPEIHDNIMDNPL